MGQLKKMTQMVEPLLKLAGGHAANHKEHTSNCGYVWQVADGSNRSSEMEYACKVGRVPALGSSLFLSTSELANASASPSVK